MSVIDFDENSEGFACSEQYVSMECYDAGINDDLRKTALFDLKALYKSRYNAAESAKVGTTIRCPTCNKKHPKRTYQHKFCCLKHKDEYWNTVDDTRRYRAVVYNG